MNVFSNLIVIKLKGSGLIIGLLFHAVITNGYNMKSMENSGKNFMITPFYHNIIIMLRLGVK